MEWTFASAKNSAKNRKLIIFDTDHTNGLLSLTSLGKEFSLTQTLAIWRAMIMVYSINRLAFITPRTMVVIWSHIYVKTPYDSKWQTQLKRCQAAGKESTIVTTTSHYSKSQIFVQKFNFDKTPTFSRVFHPKNRQFSREIKVEFLDKK